MADGVAGSLVSVNVGLPKDVAWQGRTVFTGVFKEPVSGPRRVGRLNVEGDGQGGLAGHGGEQRALFEVTQPRVTCYRVGIRMNDPRIPALQVSHRRPGFYFRVLEEGEVEAGDEIVKVASGDEHMTVAEIDALLYLPGHTRARLEQALRIPALSPGWRGSFQALLDEAPGGGNAGLAASSPPPAWPGFRRLAVTAITHESDSAISIRLEDPSGAPLPAPQPGQYLTVRVRPDAVQRAALRNDSLSGAPAAGAYRITVKREAHGAVSGYLHTRLAVGDQLDVAAPRGTFLLGASGAPVLLISAGIGATPLLAMLHALADARSGREIWWLHGARNGREQPFADEARALLAQLPRAHLRVCLSQPGPDDVKGRTFDVAGRLTASALAALPLPADSEAYICEPAPFMDDMSAGCAALGLDAAHIHTEPFGPAAPQTPGIAGGVDYDPDPVEPPTPGSGFICCSRPRDDVVLDL